MKSKRLMPLERVLARWQCLVAFMKAMSLLHQAMCSVLYHRIATAIKMASKEGKFCIVILLIVAMVVAGVIRSTLLPNGSVQLLPM